jgi:hypothetical protein
MWTRALDKARRARLKARRIKSEGKSLLPGKRQSSSPWESAAVHFVQTNHFGFGDDSKMSDNDSAVVSTEEKPSATRSDVLVSVQEKEARSEGGIMSQ